MEGIPFLISIERVLWRPDWCIDWRDILTFCGVITPCEIHAVGPTILTLEAGKACRDHMQTYERALQVSEPLEDLKEVYSGNYASIRL